MEHLQNRVNSFSKSKRVKNPNKPSSNINLKWPHPTSFKANPDTLAEAGFYFSPSAEDPDNVQCFLCDKQIGDWEEDDDPFDIHYEKCAQKCAWANIRCGLRRDMDRHGRFVFPDKSRLPTSKAMEKARLETFTAGEGWVHDSVRGHGASSKKLARAGFVCVSNTPGDDLAMCLYCNCSLSGWDKDDDPMEEHRKRKDKSDYPCPFFANDPDSEPTPKPPSTKPASRASSSKPPSSRASKSKQHQDMVMPTKTFDGDPDGTDHGDDGSDYSAKLSGTSKTPARKSRSASGSSTRKSTATAKTPRARGASKALNNVIEEDEDEDAEPQEAPATVKKLRAPSKARSKNVIISAATELDEDLVDEPPATVKKKGGRSKSVARSVASEVEEEPATVKKKRATTSRSKSVARSEKTEQSDEEDAPAVEKTVKKPSKAKGKAKAAPVPSETEESQNEQDEDEEEVVPAPRKSSRAKPKAPATVKKPSSSSSSSRSKAKAKAPEPESEPEHEDDAQFETAAEEPEAPKPRASKKPPSKTPAAKSKGEKTAAPAPPQESERDDMDVSEDEFGPVIEQPPFAPAAAAKAKAKAKAKEKEKKPPSSSSSSQQKPPSQTLAGIAALGKGKPPSSRGNPAPAPAPVDVPSSMDDDDELGMYNGAPSSDPPLAPVPPSETPTANDYDDDGEEDMEMTPLVIPKRTAAPPSSTSLRAQAVTQAARERESTAALSRTSSSSSLNPTRSSQTGRRAPSTVRASISKMQDKAKMKVVDVLSSEDDDEGEDEEKGVDIEEDEDELPQPPPPPPAFKEKKAKQKQKVPKAKDVSEVEEEKPVEPEPAQPEEVRVDLQSKTTKAKSRKASAQAKKSLMFSATLPPLNPPPQETADVPTPTLKPQPPAQQFQPAVPKPPSSSRSTKSSKEQRAPSAPPRSQSQQSPRDQNEVEEQLAEDATGSGEVSMQETDVPDTQIIEHNDNDDVEMRDASAPPLDVPRTPPRAGNSSTPPPASQLPTAQQQEQEEQNPPFFPPLSKLPFVPLPELTEAELDMTVEEWIRYQMEVEFDKFRRDGERELQRFRKRAEEARKVIEGL